VVREKKECVVDQMQSYQDQVKEEQLYKPKLYTYPIADESIGVFDYDDLAEDSYLVLCVRAKPGEAGSKHIAYVWRGEGFQEDSEEESPQEYI
jgi:hypothetical protein